MRFEEYIQSNQDLDPYTARVMAGFALAPVVTGKTLSEVFGRPCGQSFWRDRAFYWWNAMNLSGLAEYWDEFAKRRNRGERFDYLLKWLKAKAGEERWSTLSRRMGKQRLEPRQYHDVRATRTYWTRGGTWHKSSPFTTLLIEHKHLPERDLWKPWMQKLGHANVRLLELELMHEIDPEIELAGEARLHACDHVLQRVPELLRRKRPLSPKWLPWFFQTNIPYKGKRYRTRMTRPGNVRRAGGGILTWEFF
jgi:hypothetical protein